MGIIQRQSLVVSDDDILGGVPVFVGTRVPVKTLFDYLKAGHPLADFLDDFPTVGREQAEAVLEMSQRQWQDTPMKLLLDECLPRRLKRGLPGHDVSTVPEMGWAGIKNGGLLALVEAAFDVFITIDGNLRYQQNLSKKDLALVVLSASDNTIETLLPLMPQVLAALPTLVPGQVVKVAAQPGV